MPAKQFRNEKYLWTIKILYAVAAFLLLPYYRYQINADSVSYISIAFRYINHDYLNAINGGWAPMISWLLIPFIFFHIEPTSAFLIINLLTGFVGLLLFDKILSSLQINEKKKLIGLGVCSVLMLHFALTALTPDLLSVTSLLAYFYLLVKNIHSPVSNRSAALCGILGAISYFCKSYIFGFFLLHFTIHNFLQLYVQKDIPRKKILSNYFIGLTFFFLLSSAWIIPLSMKYGKFTISTAGTYNHAIIGPGLEKKYSIEMEGLIPPSDSFATSAFETFADMSHYHKLKDWSPFSSTGNSFYQLKIIAKHFYLTVAKLEVLNPLAAFIVLFILIELVRKKKLKIIATTPEFFILLFMALYISGYLLLRIQERYLWIMLLCILIFALQIMEKIQNKNIHQTIKAISILLLIGSFVIPAILQTAAKFNAGKEVAVITQSLEEKNINGNIASNSNYTYTLQLSYNLRCKYFGIPSNRSDSSSISELRKYNIDYLVWWGNEESPAFLNSYSEINLPELKIIQLK